MSRIRRLVMLVAAVALVVAGAACTPEEETAFRSVNALREANGLRWLDWNEGAYAKAVSWSNHMADEGRLSHSELSDGVPKGWHTIGENVAHAGSVEKAMAALEASAPHRANLLDPRFTSIAIGVAVRDGKVWVTEVFVG